MWWEGGGELVGGGGDEVIISFFPPEKLKHFDQISCGTVEFGLERLRD